MDHKELKEYEWKTVIRPLRIEDFDQLVAMQLACLAGMQPWDKEQIESQILHFPEGQIVIEIEGKIAASSASLMLEYHVNLEWHDWKKIADNGYIRNNSPRGDTLYGIEIMVHPDFRGMKLSRRLYDARKELCREKNLARIIVGGRIPGYGRHADEMTAREYADSVVDKQIYDPVLTAQLANGFSLQGLIPGCFPSDEASRGYATFLEWVNLDYVKGAKRRFLNVTELVRIAAVQYQMRTIQDFSDFAQQSEFFIDTASEYKCDFVLFPELHTTQLLSCIPELRPGEAARRLADFTPQYLEFYTEMSVKYNVNRTACPGIGRPTFE